MFYLETKGSGAPRVVATLNTTSSGLPQYLGHRGLSGAVDLLSGGGSVSFDTLYRSQPWVFIAVNAIARRLASMPGKVYEQVDDKRRRRLRGGENETAALVDEPYEGGSWFDFVEAIAQQYLIHGRGPAWINRAPGAPPREAVPLDMRQLRMLRSPQGKVVAIEWRETPSSDPKLLDPADIVWFGFSGGVSPLQPLAITLQIEDAAQRSTKAFYENGARPAGVFTSDTKLSPEAVERVEEMIKGKHAGVDNAFRVAVLGNVPNAKWQPFEPTARDSDTVSLRQLTREEVLAAYTVPQPIGGVLDRANFSNIDTLKGTWIVENIGVHAAMFEQRFTSQIIRPFSTIVGRDVFLEFDLSAALRGSPLEQAEAYMKLLQGVYTPNELRALDNMPPIEDAWADAIYIPSAYEAVGAPGPLNRQTSTSGSAPAAPTSLPAGGDNANQG